jgi:hypothetical protein
MEPAALNKTAAIAELDINDTETEIIVATGIADQRVDKALWCQLDSN